MVTVNEITILRPPLQVGEDDSKKHIFVHFDCERSQRLTRVTAERNDIL
jgi:hypothetical protein